MLQPGDQLPHFTASAGHGARVSYAEIWQRKQLLLVLLPSPETEAGRDYASRLAARAAEFAELDTEYVATTEAVAGVSPPGLIIADRWGEIALVIDAQPVRDLPSADDLIDWLRYLQHQCPEC